MTETNRKRLVVLLWVALLLIANVGSVGAASPTLSPTAAARIAATEADLRDSEIEIGVIFDLDGAELARVEGNYYTVLIPDETAKLIPNRVFTHNHPRGQMPYFSPMDVKMAWLTNAQQIRVVGWLGNQPYVCVADRGDHTWWALIFPDPDGLEILRTYLNKHSIAKGWELLFQMWGYDYHCEVAPPTLVKP